MKREIFGKTKKSETVEIVTLSNENAELTTALGVKQAPTLVVVKDGEAQKFTGVSDIKKMLGA